MIKRFLLSATGLRWQSWVCADLREASSRHRLGIRFYRNDVLVRDPMFTADECGLYMMLARSTGPMA